MMKFTKDIKDIRVRAVFAALTVLMLLFIFGMSAFDGDSSSELSGGLLEYINLLLSKIGLDSSLTDHILRKAAHYTEYFILGWLYLTDVLSWTGSLKKSLIYPLPAGFVTACLDELSQNFSEGRSPGIADVFIDFSGFFTAVLIFAVIIIIIKHKKGEPLSL
ncbi:MAG: VanZ family protein [Clostridiales bacterium]|nr:VanZ family protein [Clostridiales bacterium]